MPRAKYKALQIAKWFLMHNEQYVTTEGADYLSNLKIQKLLYYSQGTNLAINDVALFEEPILAWRHGPVVEKVYHEYKDNGDMGIPYTGDCDISKFDASTRSLLEEVFDVFGQYSAWQLRNMTHNETPWRRTEQNDIIPNTIIREYFLENYIGE